ncbi:MAG: hypothetical protein VXZ05_10225 [Pseudomonadota bacterium]|jgi:hypothetical protein|nr:hypothetical protein [Pseudomonadota bacterium]
MPRFNSAMDTAARFGEIPFVEFTQELITGIFDSLVEAHILQMEEYAEFVQTLTQDLSSYINNTNDGVSFEEITDFVLKYELPQIPEAQLEAALDALQPPAAGAAPTTTGAPATTDTWWGGLINALAPAVDSLVDKIEDPSDHTDLQAMQAYNDAVLAGNAATMPNYNEITSSIAKLISSNKYSLLQNLAQQGMMRLVVTDGEIETKLTFSTWQEDENTFQRKTRSKAREATKTKLRRGSLGAYKKARKRIKTRNVTVNTAKSYHRDTSGTKVDIFGRVMIRFKTDYSPLNG